jgi:hypothetical protein
MTEGNFLWMLIVVVTAIANLVSILFSLRRRPPVSEELYREYLRREEHNTLCAAMKDRFDALDSHNSETHVEIFNLIRAEREWTTENIRRMTTDIQHNLNGLHADFQVLERGLGRVEGSLKDKSDN